MRGAATPPPSYGHSPGTVRRHTAVRVGVGYVWVCVFALG